jgi:hypothetical protein
MSEPQNFISPMESTEKHMDTINTFCEHHPMIFLHFMETSSMRAPLPEDLKQILSKSEEASIKTAVSNLDHGLCLLNEKAENSVVLSCTLPG